MSKSLATKNIAAVALGLGLILALTFAFATPVKAQSIGDLQAQINALLAQIAALQGGGGGACFTFTQNLTMGSTGNEVMQAQKFLNAHGALVASAGAGSPGNETAYFGARTQAAVSAFQAMNGISPTAGYWGPITRAKANSLCVVVAPPPGPPGPPGAPGAPGGPLQGGVGTVESYKLMSTLSNEEVGEAQDDVEVAGLEIEVDNGSDIGITAVRLNFDVGTAASDFEKYASEVSIWLDGKEIGRVDADQFNDDNAFASTISATNAVIRAGDTAELTVGISGISNLDSADATDTWTIDITSVRFVDASGASTSEDPTTGTRTFSFEAFATAADAELKIAADDDDVNDAHLIDVHATNKTSGVALASFTLEAEGDSDLEIKKFGVNVDVAGTADDVSDVISGGASPAIWLEIEGENYGTATYGGDSTTAYTEQTTAGGEDASENVLFDDVDYTIDAGDKVTVLIKADILALSGALTEADTIQVTLTETETDNTALVDVEDESNEQIVDADITGTLTTGAHAAFDIGITVALVPGMTNAAALSNDNAVDNDIGTFTMVFDITAFGGSVYIGDTADATTVADGSLGIAAVTNAIVYRLYDSGTATTDDDASTVTFTTPSGVTDSTDNILITEGSTSRVTLTVTQTNDTAEDDGIYYMDLAAIYWGIADDTTYENEYIYDLDAFETSTVSLN